MIKIAAGCILMIWGAGGIIANIVFVVAFDVLPIMLVLNTAFAALFVYGGIRLYRSGRGYKLPTVQHTKYKGVYK
jgi:hypothetical protein